MAQIQIQMMLNEIGFHRSRMPMQGPPRHSAPIMKEMPPAFQPPIPQLIEQRAAGMPTASSAFGAPMQQQPGDTVRSTTISAFGAPMQQQPGAPRSITISASTFQAPMHHSQAQRPPFDAHFSASTHQTSAQQPPIANGFTGGDVTAATQIGVFRQPGLSKDVFIALMEGKSYHPDLDKPPTTSQP